MRGFGSLSTRRKEIARNISHNTAIVIDEHYIPSFKPAKIFVNKIKSSEKVKQNADKEPKLLKVEYHLRKQLKDHGVPWSFFLPCSKPESYSLPPVPLVVWLIFCFPSRLWKMRPSCRNRHQKLPMPCTHRHSLEVLAAISQLKAKLAAEPEKTNSAIFADSLAGLCTKSLAVRQRSPFAEQANAFFESTEREPESQGRLILEAFTFCHGAIQTQGVGRKSARILWELQQNADNLDLKTKMVPCHMEEQASRPAQGVAILRRCLHKIQNSKPALFNMGMLSVQSTNTEKPLSGSTNCWR